MKVLIIDDERDICYLLSSLLKQKDMHVEYANTLSEAASSLKNMSPHVVFLDNHLPDGLGLNFISSIKRSCPDSKVIMLTAHDTPSDRNRAILEGADYFISKPITRDAIYTVLDQLKAG